MKSNFFIGNRENSFLKIQELFGSDSKVNRYNFFFSKNRTPKHFNQKIN